MEAAAQFDVIHDKPTQFNPDNAKAHSRQGKIRKAKGSNRASLRNAIDLQEFIMNDAVQHEKLSGETDTEGRLLVRPSDLAQLARAWCDLEETKRKLRMKPLPGSLRPIDKPKRQPKPGPIFSPAPPQVDEQPKP